MGVCRFLPILITVLCGLGGEAVAEAPAPRQPQARIEAGSHTSVVRRIDTDAAGDILVSGSDDKTVRVWSLKDGALLKVLRVPIADGDVGKIFAIAVSPDGATVAAGGWDDADAADGRLAYHIYIFDRQRGTLLKRLGPVPNAVNDLDFSPDGQWLAAGFATGGLSVWDARSWEFLGSDTDYSGAVYGLTFARRGGFAAASRDGVIRYYDEHFDLVTTMPGPSGAYPETLAFSPDGASLAVSYAETAAVDILAVPSLLKSRTLDVSGIKNGDVAAIAWSADGRRIFGGGNAYSPKERMPLFVWEGETRVTEADAAGDTILDVAALPDGGVAVAAADHSISVFNPDLTLRFRRGMVAPDMRGKIGDSFTASSDLRQVRFGLGPEARDPWMVDLARPSVSPSREPPEGLRPAETQSLSVEDWNGGDRPAVNDVPLRLDAQETSRSIAIAPDAKSLVMGTDWALRRFSTDGRQIWQRPVPETVWGVNLSADGAMFVAAIGDGTLRWYRTEDGAELLAFFLHAGDHRWIAWTPKGYFAASPGGESLIGWHVNRGWDKAADFFPVSQFHDRFYRPDVIDRVLALRDEDKALEAANAEARRKPEPDTVADMLPPVIEIIDPAPGATFSSTELRIRYKAQLRDGQSLTRVDVLVDGRPLGTRGASATDEPEMEGEIAVTLPARNAAVSLIAYAGDVPSVPATLQLRWGGIAGLSDPRARLYALLVGVSDYELASLKLNFADDDARDFGTVLQGSAGRNYQSVEARVITDREATSDQVREGLSWLEANVGPDDTGLLFLAGHGVTDSKQRFFYLPADADPSENRLRATAISEREIQDTISNIAGKAVFLIDACHSAAGLDGRDKGPDVTGVVNRLARADTGVVMFASSTGREVSFEREDWKNGAFTEALLEGLAGKADYEEDGQITIAELNLWLSSRVAQLTDNRQNAVMLKPDTIRDFALAASGGL